MKVTVIEIKHYQLKNILIRLDHKNIINYLEKSDTWKIRLRKAINFISSKDNNKERVMHSERDNNEFMVYDNADEVIEELFKSVLSRYQIGFEKSMRGSDFILSMYYKCHKLNPNWGEL